jgi:hypothetical protein
MEIKIEKSPFKSLDDSFQGPIESLDAPTKNSHTEKSQVKLVSSRDGTSVYIKKDQENIQSSAFLATLFEDCPAEGEEEESIRIDLNGHVIQAVLDFLKLLPFEGIEKPLKSRHLCQVCPPRFQRFLDNFLIGTTRKQIPQIKGLEELAKGAAFFVVDELVDLVAAKIASCIKAKSLEMTFALLFPSSSSSSFSNSTESLKDAPL